MFDFEDNYSQVKDRVSNSINSNDWCDKERLEMHDILRKSGKIEENEVYLFLLSVDLSEFILRGNWHFSEIDINSEYRYILVFASELNKLIKDKNENPISICNRIQPLIKFYKKERQLEFFLDNFYSIEWYVTATIRISRELLRYSKINSKYKLGYKEPKTNLFDKGDIIVAEDEMLAVLVSRIRELLLNKSDEKHSSSFTYILKITTLIDREFKKSRFNEKIEDIRNQYKEYLDVFSIKRNKENFHITSYKSSVVVRNKVIQSETTINIPMVYEILDAFVDIYEDYRNNIINTLSLEIKDLPKRVKIKPTRIGDLYLRYSLK
ncbi:hypothetical protein [Acholeplasma laidlawii]|uniref:hypothetical protein n=1 Tax=Acholeplasma laidlawii TaxID=2148 RepID=UPI0021F74787|nr:hypothetical protein [Acholeplasma laidlawii]